MKLLDALTKALIITAAFFMVCLGLGASMYFLQMFIMAYPIWFTVTAEVFILLTSFLLIEYKT